MDPSMYKTNNDITTASSPFLHRHSNPNVLISTPHPISPSALTSNKTHSTNHRYSYSDLPSGSTSALNYMDLFRNWNYHQYLISSVKTDPLSDHSSDECPPRNSSFHQYYPRSFDKASSQSINEEHILGKFHYDTVVQLETGESKNIQQLTTHDLLASAQQSPRYSSLLARIDYIGIVDHSTGKVELRFYIEEIDKMTSYYVLQEMPFFVQQYSCWSSVSPEYTHRLCGLKCRQLECGDQIIAVTERLKSLPKNHPSVKPDYRQQSPTKSLVGRYIDGEISTSNKRPRLSNE